MITVYGIKNCDTMKKAFAWLDANGVAYRFHDYKKEGADKAALALAIAEHGWENVINRKGTTWRGLDEKTRERMDEKAAVKAAIDNPSLVRRPLIVRGGKTYLGFDAAVFAKAFG
jgi:Spx/MgsR family transcriptional regulator